MSITAKEKEVAKLVIEEMPRTKDSQTRLVNWLKEKIKELESSDPDQYAEPFTSRLMK